MRMERKEETAEKRERERDERSVVIIIYTPFNLRVQRDTQLTTSCSRHGTGTARTELRDETARDE